MNEYCLSYDFYIKKILKKINPQARISKELLESINSIINKLSKKFIKESSILSDKKIKIDNLLEIIPFILTGDLNKLCIEFSKKTLKRYRRSLLTNPERMNNATRSKLIFPPSKARKLMEKHSCKLFTRDNFSILLASIIEFFIYELLDITFDKSLKNNSNNLNYEYFNLAINDDLDMKEFLLNINFRI